MDQLIQEFSLERVSKSGAVFNVEKLNWLNQQHIKLKSNEELAQLVKPYLQLRGWTKIDEQYLIRVVGLMKERLIFPQDLADNSGYFFLDPESFDEAGFRKNWDPESCERLKIFADRLAVMQEYSQPSIEAVLRQFSEDIGVKPSKLIHPLRLALSGKTIGPGLFEMMELLGKETVIRRLIYATNKLQMK
jgi:glutamyl-tRNA synthetase